MFASSLRRDYDPVPSGEDDVAARDATAAVPTGRIPKAALRLHLLCLFFAIGSSVWGYNVGVLSSIMVHPGFVAAVGGLGPSRKGVVTAVYYAGTWTSYVFVSRAASDLLGRRFAAMSGVVVACVGTALQALAAGPAAFTMVICGRIVAGVGVAILSTSVPLYQSEISPAKERGRFVVMNHVGFVVGLASGFWVGYAMTFWDTPYGANSGWRYSFAVQFIPSAIFALGLPFLPETPRWLAEHDKLDLARRSLHYFREGSFTNREISHEFDAMTASVAEFRASGLTSWRCLFTEPSLFRRLWRAALLQFMGQMCGATAMKYYLPTLLEVLGLDHRVALMAGGIESTLKIGMTLLDSILIDRMGRRLTLAVGAGAMAFAMLINGALPLIFPNNTNRAADITCVVFIFIYALGFSMGFGPAAWVYGAEVFPTAIRARGLNLAASGGSIGSILVAQIWPLGIHRIGTKIYFFFMAVNLICVPVIYILYPETKGRALEDMDVLFGKIGEASVDDRQPERPSAAGGRQRHKSRTSGEESTRLVQQ
ncbi:hypothetical protein RB594_006832 [Gaeumannomyces avenae]